MKTPLPTARLLPISLVVMLAAYAPAVEFDTSSAAPGDAASAGIGAAFDRDLATVWQSAQPQADGVGVTLDFGKPVLVHRVYLTPGARTQDFPRSLRVKLSADGKTWSTAAGLENVEHAFRDPDLRFNPAAGRYLRIEIGKEGAAFPFSIAELHVYGFADAQAVESVVVLPDDMPPFVRHAARDLAYYVGEISGTPVAVVPLAQASGFAGRRFLIGPVEDREFAPDDWVHRETEQVQVREEEDGAIRFGGCTPRALMYSVYEFLDRQGVRWLYPHPQGHFLKRRGELDLSVLPIRYAPQFVLRPHGYYVRGRFRPNGESIRWLAHGHFNQQWNHPGRNNEVSGGPTDYRVFGHHRLRVYVPNELYAEHPDWFPAMTDPKWRGLMEAAGYKLGDRIPYGTLGHTSLLPCTTSPGARERIVRQALKSLEAHPEHSHFMLSQEDAANWCECARCRAFDEEAGAPMVPSDRGMLRSKTERLVDLALYVDRRLKEELPGRTVHIAMMAYSQTVNPPVNVDKLPATMSVTVVQNGIDEAHGPHAPLAFSERDRRLYEGWARIAEHVGFYNLILANTADRHPRATITGLGEWMRFWNALKLEETISEWTSTREAWSSNPWLFYAFARLTWNPEEPTEDILNDFFNGYFAEAAAPMLRYYRTLERHVRENGLSYKGGPKDRRAMFAPPVGHELLSLLRQAEAAASRYRTKQRVADVFQGFRIAVKETGVPVELDAE